MKEPGLDGRHRNQDGRIDQKRSDTKIGTLRQTYPGIAPGVSDNKTLGDVRRATGKQSLNDIRRSPKK